MVSDSKETDPVGVVAVGNDIVMEWTVLPTNETDGAESIWKTNDGAVDVQITYTMETRGSMIIRVGSTLSGYVPWAVHGVSPS
jgi:hypothetical protein